MLSFFRPVLCARDRSRRQRDGPAPSPRTEWTGAHRQLKTLVDVIVVARRHHEIIIWPYACYPYYHEVFWTKDNSLGQCNVEPPCRRASDTDPVPSSNFFLESEGASLPPTAIHAVESRSGGRLLYRFLTSGLFISADVTQRWTINISSHPDLDRYVLSGIA